MARILVGTTSWTEATLVESGRFYPSEVHTAEERLRYYVRRFTLVEVDRPYQVARPRGLVTSHDSALAGSPAMSLADRTSERAAEDLTAQNLHNGTPSGSAHLVPFRRLV